MSRTLDRSKPFGQVCGEESFAFEQGGLRFDATGKEIVEKGAKTAAPKASAKPAADSTGKAPDSDQVTSQLQS